MANFTKMSAAQEVAIAIDSDGRMFSWGDNSAGATGHQTLESVTWLATQVETDTDWAECATGSFSDSDAVTLAIKTNGTLWACGNTNTGKSGLPFNGAISTFTQVGTDTDWETAYVGRNMSYLIKTDGTLWGLGDANYLGLVNWYSFYQLWNTPGLTNQDIMWYDVEQGGQNRSAIIKTDGTLWARGSNINGCLGFPLATNSVLDWTQVGTDTDWIKVCLAENGGESAILAIKSGGTLWSAGSNQGGLTGQGTVSGNTELLTQVGSATTWTSVSSQSGYVVSLTSAGTLWSWGDNTNYQTGQNTNTGILSSPTQIGVATTWTDCAAGGLCGAAIQNNSTLFTWGNNANGRTAQNTTAGATQVPTVVASNSTGWSSFIYTDSAIGIGIRSTNQLWVFGPNANGQTGLNTTVGDTIVPTRVGTDTDWSVPFGGFQTTCATKTNGTLYSCGVAPYNGQGTSSGNTLVFTQVGSAIDWTAILGAHTGYAGVLKGVSNSLWQAGGPNQSTGLLVGNPAQIGADVDWASFDSIANASIGIKTDGTMWSTGTDPINGQGNPGAAYLLFTQIGSDTDWAEISLSGQNSQFALARKTDGTIYSWGSNSSGQTAQNTATGTTDVITQIGSDTDWASISGGTFWGAAIKSDGTLWAWGDDSDFKTLQPDGTGDTLVPTATTNTDTDWTKVVCGGNFGMALK